MFFNKKISLLRDKSGLTGSLSLEAGIVLPIFMFAIITVLSLIEVVRAYGDIESGLHKAGREISLYGSAAEVAGTDIGDVSESLIGTVLTDMYGATSLSQSFTKENGQSTEVIDGQIGVHNFILSSSDSGKDIVDLCVIYNVRPIFNIFGVKPVQICNRCYLHSWTGYSGNEGDGSEIEYEQEMVYVTETGVVYHRNSTCTYLDLSISSISKDAVNDARNYEGGKYSACKYCGGKKTGEKVFITNYGNSYHTTLACSGLKRTVSCIPLSEVGSRGPCSKCGGKSK